MSIQSELVQQLAARLGQPDGPDELLARIEAAIEDAEGDVEGYLGRPIYPVTKTVAGCWPLPGGWDILGESGRIRDIISATPEVAAGIELGTFTVTYTVGIDYLNDPETRPIRRYITAAALNNYELLNYLQSALHMRGPVASVSVSTEGQSKTVTYGHLGYTPPASRGSQSQDYPGSLPKLTSLDRWKVAGRRVVQAPDLGYDPRLNYPFSGNGVPYRDREGFWNLP